MGGGAGWWGQVGGAGWGVEGCRPVVLVGVGGIGM